MEAHPPSRPPLGWLRRLSRTELAALAVVLAALVLRLLWFWRLPGINGDEAWYGVQALNLASGEPVQWRTPTGNLVSPAQLLSIWLLHLVVDPAPWVLRAPVLLSGAVQVALTWLFVARAFGRSAGAAAAVLCAVLPVNMAYARFGWDPSHLGLWGVLAAAAALERRTLWLGLTFALGLWVHPTHVFLAPFLGVTLVAATLARQEPVRVKVTWSVTAFVLLAGASYGLRVITSGASRAAPPGAVLERLSAPEQWATHATRLAEFFLGDATYAYLTGAGLPGPSGVWVAAFWSVVAVVLAVGTWRLVRARAWKGLGVVVGAGLTHLAFFAIAGPENLAPHVERFGLVLVVPSLLAFVAAAFAPPSPSPAGQQARSAAVVLAGVLLLGGFVRFYLVELQRTGSTSHPTFWTGPVEPKVLAVQRILASRRPDAPVVILTDGWWTRWLAHYLTYRQPGVRVASTVSQVRFGAGGQEVYVLGFPGGVAERWVAQRGGSRRFAREDVPGYGRPAAVSIWHYR